MYCTVRECGENGMASRGCRTIAVEHIVCIRYTYTSARIYRFIRLEKISQLKYIYLRYIGRY